ncbi:Vacuolar protein sorting-associated protein vps5 [Schizosaccharomyces pombe]
MLGHNIYEEDDAFNPFADSVSPLNPPKTDQEPSAEGVEEESPNVQASPPKTHIYTSPRKRSVNLKSLPFETLTLDSAPLGPLQFSDAPSTAPENNRLEVGLNTKINPLKGSSPALNADFSANKPWISEVNSFSPSPIGATENPTIPNSEQTVDTLDAASSSAPNFTHTVSSASSQKQGSTSLTDTENQKAHPAAAPQSLTPFYIQVHDPHTVKEITKSHTVYSVSTRLEEHNQPSVSNVTVQRRYNDFAFLYQLLSNNHPGCIIPPIPEKQVVGRFDDEFIEQRRAALEVMLRKISAHPVLRDDYSFKLFLEAETFDPRMTHRTTLIESSSSPLRSGPSTSGLLDSFTSAFHTSGSSKFSEQDPILIEAKDTLDSLETQLKSVYHALLLSIDQRIQFASAIHDFGEAVGNLSLVDLEPTLSSKFDGLSQLQVELRFVQERKVAQDNLTLGTTLEEYIRYVESAKNAFITRQKLWQTWQSSVQAVSRAKTQLEKCKKQAKSQQKSLPYLEEQYEKYRAKAADLEKEFSESTTLLKRDLSSLTTSRVDDLKASVETWLESAIESQKEIIERWESFLDQ